jgi:hypothetical protein
MPTDTSAPESSADTLDAAGNDADNNAGSNGVDDPVSACPDTETGPLWVRLDLTPDLAANDPGSLRLEGSGYDSTLAIAGSFEPNADPDNTVDVVFQGVPIKGSYTLTYIADGTQLALVQGASYSSLQDDALPPGEDSSGDNSDAGASDAPSGNSDSDAPSDNGPSAIPSDDSDSATSQEQS